MLATFLLPVLLSTLSLCDTTCTQPRVRKEWRELSALEKLDYIKAVQCLHLKPPQGANYYPAQTRYDDFASLHINRTTAPSPGDTANRLIVGPGIHFNGVFLPWHRYALWNYETALRNECGYKGAQPYWDWSLDTPEHGSHFNESPVFDPVLGFGGNGVDGSVPVPAGPAPNASQPTIYGSCPAVGPFAVFKPSLGPGWNLNTASPHCVKRNLQVASADLYMPWKANILPLLRMTDFANFTASFDKDAGGTGSPFGIHGAGHSGVGGEMTNVWSSINDPLFWMHHAQLDRVWALWQSLNEKNIYAIGGPIYPNGTGLMTLDYPVEMASYIAPTLTIRAVMDTRNKNGKGALCYYYQENGQPTP